MEIFIGMFMFMIVVILTVISIFRSNNARREKSLEEKIDQRVRDEINKHKT